MESGDRVNKSRACGAKGVLHQLYLHALLVYWYSQQAHVHGAEEVNRASVGRAFYQHYVTRSQQQPGHRRQCLVRPRCDQDLLWMCWDALAGHDLSNSSAQGWVTGKIAVIQSLRAIAAQHSLQRLAKVIHRKQFGSPQPLAEGDLIGTHDGISELVRLPLRRRPPAIEQLLLPHRPIVVG